MKYQTSSEQNCLNRNKNKTSSLLVFLTQTSKAFTKIDSIFFGL
jgi:hypothetical protein